MDINLDVKNSNGSFRTIQDQPSHRRQQREVAIYLRDGSIWVGHFTVDNDGLDFGDDRLDAAHGLGDLLHSETLKTSFTGISGQGRPTFNEPN